MIGDIAVPVKSFDMSISFDQSLRHFTAPVAASNAVSTAVVPSVKTRPPATSGVENGPFDISRGVLVLVDRGLVALRPDRLACGQVEGGDDFFGILPAVDVDASVDDDRRRIALADRLLPLDRGLCRPRRGHRRLGHDAVAVRARATAATGRESEAVDTESQGRRELVSLDGLPITPNV